MTEAVRSDHAVLPVPRGFDGLLRQRVFGQLALLQHGRLVIEDPYGRAEFGAAAARVPLEVTLTVRDSKFYRMLACQGSVGAAEAYIEGYWSCSELVVLVRLLVRNRELLDDLETGVARAAGWALRAWQALQPNTRAGSRRNIAAHYDLGNEFFGLFLSDDLMYSSALWAGEADTLESASKRKLEQICEKLALRPQDRVAPLWILALWAAFATTITRSLAFVRARPGAGMLLGALAAPLAYLAAEHGFHAVNLSPPPWRAEMCLAAGWAGTMWLLQRLAWPAPAAVLSP